MRFIVPVVDAAACLSPARVVVPAAVASAVAFGAAAFPAASVVASSPAAGLDRLAGRRFRLEAAPHFHHPQCYLRPVVVQRRSHRAGAYPAPRAAAQDWPGPLPVEEPAQQDSER